MELSPKQFNLKKKVENHYKEFALEIQRLTPDELDNRIMNYAKNIEETQLAMDSNEKIQQLKEELKELKGPYTDTIKALKAKIAYVYIVMLEELNG